MFRRVAEAEESLPEMTRFLNKSAVAVSRHVLPLLGAIELESRAKSVGVTTLGVVRPQFDRSGFGWLFVQGTRYSRY